MREKHSHAKVIVTLGTASDSIDIIHKMINEGVDVFRLNFSYSTQDENLKLISIIVYTEIHGSTNMIKVSFI